MELHERITAFVKLGVLIKEMLEQKNQALYEVMKKTEAHNPWFTIENQAYALQQNAVLLHENNLVKWTSLYPGLYEKKLPVTVAVIMAGNIPLVGFHDFVSVLMSGNIFLGKTSSKDRFLPEFIAGKLIEIEKGFADYIIFTEQVKKFDAVIATGSNNASRYFNYYFGRYPHIIRKNRNSLGILTGNESPGEMEALADDIFMYFGLGCRNVSKLYLPEDFKMNSIFEFFSKYSNTVHHNKYGNNYDYQKAIMQMNRQPFWDSGFMLLREAPMLSSPVAVVHFEYYKNRSLLENELNSMKDQIQCIVSSQDIFKGAVPFGKTQQPELWDYADGIDTMKFLLDLA